MSYSSLPLSYCGNVHPAETVDDLLRVLQGPTAEVQSRVGRPIAAGLWLAKSVVTELDQNESRLAEVAEALAAQGLICYTLNAFPFGNFHSERVKEQVYLPDWTDPARTEYTLACARVLAQLLPDGVEGSISTVPLGLKALCDRPDFVADCCAQLLELAIQLDELHDQTGRVIRLAIEPEPLCVLETTAETLRFFERLRTLAAERDCANAVATHLGVCYDICHQAVEFEDVAASIATLQQADIRINKVHITCAIELEHPRENVAGREFLAQFAEPRYLHQMFMQAENGTASQVDLTAAFALDPPTNWLQADCWRIHFHVPVQAESLGPLATTRPALLRGLEAVRQLQYAPHLEVETYTWNVLPGAGPADVCAGLARELAFVQELLASS